MKKILLFALVAFALSSCTKSDDIDPNCIENIDPDCVCGEIYNPVCGCNDVTYGNPCEAECAGIVNYTMGRCQ